MREFKELKGLKEIRFKFLTEQEHYNFNKGYDRVERITDDMVTHFLCYSTIKEDSSFEDKKIVIAEKCGNFVQVFFPAEEIKTKGISALRFARIKMYMPKGYEVKRSKGKFLLFANGEKIDNVRSIMYKTPYRSIYLSRAMEEVTDVQVIKN